MDRGSRHILSQDKILAECNSSERPSALTISWELEGYEIADRISIPSSHVDESFREYQITKSEVIPYGVDLRMFPFRPQRRPTETFTFITIGQWSLRKGSDILAAAVRRISGARLVHVGSIVDVEFPQEDAKFVHFGSVRQHELTRFYADSDTFVLASREDGLVLSWYRHSPAGCLSFALTVPVAVISRTRPLWRVALLWCRTMT